MSAYESIPRQALIRGSDALVELPVTVWPTAQQAPRTQRGTRYVPEATAHPAKMLPARGPRRSRVPARSWLTPRVLEAEGAVPAR